MDKDNMAKKDIPAKSHSPFLLGSFLLTAVIIITVFFYFLFLLYFQNRFYPGVKIAGLEVSGQKPEAVKNYLQVNFNSRTRESLSLTYRKQTFALNLNQALPDLNTDEAIAQGYRLGRSGAPLVDLKDQLKILIFGASFDPKLTFNQPTLLLSQIKQINEAIKEPAKNAKITIGDKIEVIPSQNGKQLDDQEFIKQISDYLIVKTGAPVTIPIKIALPAFPTQTALKYQALLQKNTTDPIKLHYQKQIITLDPADLLSILNLNENKPVLASGIIAGQPFVLEQISLKEATLSDSEALIDHGKLADFLRGYSNLIDQPPQDAKFTINPQTLKVSEFRPAKEGKSLDIDQTAQLITEALEDKNTKDITLPVVVTQPKITTESVNNLGIKDLLSEGSSHFEHSIENRIYNIGLAASRIHGTLIAPGDVFSFNKVVGDISGKSGYKPAYVIKSGRTVLDDGGGVCQVSTTVFRAALKAGLPIVERTAHAYRVGYYEQDSGPGLDATVFAPSVDLKFKNDTGNYILIQAYTVGLALYVDIYGSSDGRQTVISQPVITSQTPPLPDVRQDDPTLPKGQVKQVDWSAWGATSYFTRTVSRGGQTLINETFKSNYRPWAAVYLVGTQ